jgi:GNAT superfamily N-acetyltransferase
LLKQLVDTAGHADKLRALQLEAEADIQAFEPVIPRHESDFPGPDAIPDATFVAVNETGDYVGLACLTGDPARAELGTGLTGVARSFRGRGIATALKVRTILAAQQLGCSNLNTGGGGSDTPMMRINRKVGFEIEPAWITFRKGF